MCHSERVPRKMLRIMLRMYATVTTVPPTPVGGTASPVSTCHRHHCPPPPHPHCRRHGLTRIYLNPHDKRAPMLWRKHDVLLFARSIKSVEGGGLKYLLRLTSDHAI